MGMGMKFAGFMAAAKDDRLDREKKEREDALRQDDRAYQSQLIADERAYNDKVRAATWDHEATIKGLDEYKTQKEKDEKLAREVGLAMSSFNIPESERAQVAQYVETMGFDGFSSAYNDTLFFTPEGQRTANEGGSKFKATLDAINDKEGLPAGYLHTVAGIESNWNPGARNALGSPAAGMFQFIPGTAKEYDVDPMDWVSSAGGAARLAKANQNYLRKKLGREPTAAELYLAHQQGMGGAAKLLTQPDARAADLIGLKAVQMNLPKDLRGKAGQISAKQMAGIWTSKYASRAGWSLEETALPVPMNSAEADALIETSPSRRPDALEAQTEEVLDEVAESRKGWQFRTGPQIDMNDLAGKDVAYMDTWEVANRDKMTATERDKFEQMREIASYAEAGSEAWRDPHKLAQMSADSLKRYKANITDPEAHRVIDAAIEATDDTSGFNLSEELKKVKNVKDGYALSASIQANTSMTDEAKAIAQAALDPLIKQHQEQDAKDAMADKSTWMTVLERDANGMYTGSGTRVVHNGTSWVDAQGNEVEVSPTNLVSDEQISDAVQRNNTRMQPIADTVTNGMKAVGSALEYREMAIKQPQLLNGYITTMGKVMDQIRGAMTAAEVVTIGGANGVTYNEYENQFMASIQHMTEDGQRMLQAQLRTAYAMAAADGSSGQALSDKELLQNLQAIGQGVSDPGAVVSAINGAITSIMRNTEASRLTQADSIYFSPQEKQALVDMPIFRTFDSYVRANADLFGGDAAMQRLDEALAGKTDYDYVYQARGNAAEAQGRTVQADGAAAPAPAPRQAAVAPTPARQPAPAPAPAPAPQPEFPPAPQEAQVELTQKYRAVSGPMRKQLIADYDKVFGPGAAARVLGGN